MGKMKEKRKIIKTHKTSEKDASSLMKEELSKKMDFSSSSSTPIQFIKDGKGESKLYLDPKYQGSLEEAYLNIIGTKDVCLATAILVSGEGSFKGNFDDFGKEIILQSLNNFKPKDAMESRLVVQSTCAFHFAMRQMQIAANCTQTTSMEAHGSLALKFMRVHNETIEALSRYHRGGEQKVTVMHVAEKMAVVNNFNGMGGGESQENKGDKPCQQYAEPKQEPTVMSHVDNPQWLMGDAACTEESVQGQKQKKVCDA